MSSRWSSIRAAIAPSPPPRAREHCAARGDRRSGRPGRRVEVHLHDADLDLYGRRLFVTLVARLRPTLRFDGVDALIAQTADDVARCRAFLAFSPASP
ncbi:riboflavin kinase [Microbacterium maritypicum]|uniref:riboflavin kinase n=1 Tax=Microbacterium maritypicum TaxID=33918 RepID=UPI0035310041